MHTFALVVLKECSLGVGKMFSHLASKFNLHIFGRRKGADFLLLRESGMRLLEQGYPASSMT